MRAWAGLRPAETSRPKARMRSSLAVKRAPLLRCKRKARGESCTCQRELIQSQWGNNWQVGLAGTSCANRSPGTVCCQVAKPLRKQEKGGARATQQQARAFREGHGHQELLLGWPEHVNLMFHSGAFAFLCCNPLPLP